MAVRYSIPRALVLVATLGVSCNESNSSAPPIGGALPAGETPAASCVTGADGDRTDCGDGTKDAEPTGALPNGGSTSGAEQMTPGPLQSESPPAPGSTSLETDAGGSSLGADAAPSADAGPSVDDVDVVRPTFTNPLNASSGSDPWMMYHEGRYYLMATTWNSTLTIKSGSTMQELKDSTPIVIWNGDDPNRCCNMWAPELHLLDGPNGPRWYLYFSAGRTGDDYGFQRSHVLESAGTDPLGPYTYRATFFPDTWAIDGSVLRVNDDLYFIFSSNDGSQSIFIAPMSNPFTISGPRIVLSRPTLPWELFGDFPVNEGPVALEHEGRTFIVYSASFCASPEYKLGLLELTAENPLAAGAWTKYPDPVFQQVPASGIFGPAHNGFFKSPDGTEDWIVYHANSDADAGCYLERNTRVQRFSWNADGTPNFGVPLALGTAITVPSGE